MQVGSDGDQSAVLAFNSVQVLLALPSTSNPLSQEYVAVSPMLSPDADTLPKAGSNSTGHKASWELDSTIIHN